MPMPSGAVLMFYLPLSAMLATAKPQANIPLVKRSASNRELKNFFVQHGP